MLRGVGRGPRSFWMVYEGALGRVNVCAAMTKPNAEKLIVATLKTGLIPWAEMWEQFPDSDRVFHYRFTDKDLD